MPVDLEKLPKIPRDPGVYLFKDRLGEILYVGKAKALRNRVRSYFRKSQKHEPRISKMLIEAEALEWIITDTENEALGLENNFIKEYRPRYNILLRDDKTYPYLKITTGEDFPEALIVRRVLKDGHRYFGPFIPGGSARRLLHVLHRHFKVRQCKGGLSSKKAYGCIYYQLHQCDGPCSSKITRADYRRQTKDAVEFLRGRTRELAQSLAQKMTAASQDEKFEKAATYRDLLKVVESHTPAEQKMDTIKTDELDAFALERGAGSEKRRAALYIFRMRKGKVVHRAHFGWADVGSVSDKKLMATALGQFYKDADEIPPEVLLSCLPEDSVWIENWLREKRQGAVHLRKPQIGDKKKLLALVAKNARLALGEKEDDEALSHDWEILGLEETPRRIDGFDISHFQGSEPVASMVVWKGEGFSRKDYRKYNIKNPDIKAGHSDDFASMNEVLRRRISRALKEGTEMPDLIMVDGGKGQVSAARKALSGMGVDIPLVGLAKKQELLYLSGRSKAIRLPETSPVLQTLIKLRDEAHRFAITFHRSKRKKRTLKSTLEDIPGIGKKTAKLLLKTFGSLDAIKKADEKALAEVVGKKKAEAVKSYFTSN